MKKSRQDKLVEEANADPANVDFDTIENKRKILSYLTRVSASYISEIAWNANLTEYQVKQLLTLMYHDKLITEEAVTIQGNPQLLPRVPEMSMKGMGGFENFAKKKWYAITKAGVAALQ